MTAHAIVIGIDEYANGDWKLDSAVDDATRFLEWALEHGGVAPGDATAALWPNPGAPAGVNSVEPTRANLEKVFRAFKKNDAQINTQRLYVYFAGHGISAPGVGTGGGPVLVMKDVAEIDESNLMYQLDDIVETLRDAPPREQFFFIDACRDFVLEDQYQAQPTHGAWMPRPGVSASAQYGLLATAPGQKAIGVRGMGVFTSRLLDALQANGPRLTARGPDFTLTLDNIFEYVEEEVLDAIQRSGIVDWERYVQKPVAFGRVGRPDPQLWRKPRAAVPARELSIVVNPQLAREVSECRLMAYDADEPRVRRGSPLDRLTILKAPPGDYELVIKGSGYKGDPREIKLWRAKQQLQIDLELDEGLESAVSPVDPRAPVSLTIDAGQGGNQIEIEQPDGRKVDGADVKTIQGPAGVYHAQITRPGGGVEKRRFVLRAGQRETWNAPGPPMQVDPSVAHMLGNAGLAPRPDGSIGPSELLPHIPDLTLGGVLGLSAFAQVYPNQGDMQRLRGLGVAVPKLAAGRSAITVVVATADGDLPLLDHVVATIDAQRTPMTRLAKFPAATQTTAVLAEGPHQVVLRMPGQPETTYAVAGLRGWVSVLVVVHHKGAGLDVQQYTVLGDPEMRGSIPHPNALIACERAQRQFAAGRPDEIAAKTVDDLLMNKWFDPLFACIAGYSLAQLGKLGSNAGHWVDNMRSYFGALPDSHVLAALAKPAAADEHFSKAVERGTPVFAAGLRALHGWLTEAGEPLPPHIERPYRKLVPGVVWTAWLQERP